MSAEKVALLFPVAAEYPVAVMPNAKSFFPETHPRFIGSYWGQVSTPFTVEIVEVGRGTPAGPIGSVHCTGQVHALLTSELLGHPQPAAVPYPCMDAPVTAASLLCRPQMHTSLLEQYRTTTAQ